MSLKDHFERFCSRPDNPTFNMLEVEIKRTIHGLSLERHESEMQNSSNN